MSIERNYSPEEKRLLYLFLTVKKIAKVRRLYINPNGTPRFEEIEREGYAIDFPVYPEEFAFISHIKDAREGRPLQPVSNVYFNFRNMTDEMLTLTGKILSALPLEKRPDCFAGIPTTGLSIAHSLYEATQIPRTNIFQKQGQEGNSYIITSSHAQPGKGALLYAVDDVLTKATSSAPALQAAKNIGYRVLGLIVLVDRQEGGTELLTNSGYKVYSWMTAKELLDYYVQQKDETRITEKQYQKAMDSLLR